MLVDTHAHLQFDVYADQVAAVVQRATDSGVERIITVGVDLADSAKAVEIAVQYPGVWAAVGVHPHEAGKSHDIGELRRLAALPKVVAIGECGIDLYRDNAPVEVQEALLRQQIELAIELDLPLIFHVREAFDSFLPLIAEYPDICGVVHSFSAGHKELDAIMATKLYVALNGITTFSKNPDQLAAAKAVPLDRLILETDCPFLSPAPYRGKTNEPARISVIASWLAEHRGEAPLELAAVTSRNAAELFNLETVHG